VFRRRPVPSYDIRVLDCIKKLESQIEVDISEGTGDIASKRNRKRKNAEKEKEDDGASESEEKEEEEEEPPTKIRTVEFIEYL
jgi:hypothetical protein